MEIMIYVLVCYFVMLVWIITMHDWMLAKLKKSVDVKPIGWIVCMMLLFASAPIWPFLFIYLVIVGICDCVSRILRRIKIIRALNGIRRIIKNVDPSEARAVHVALDQIEKKIL